MAIALVAILAVSTAIVILFSRRVASVGMRAAFSVLAVIAPFMVSLSAPLLKRGSPDWLTGAWFFAVLVSPYLVRSIFVVCTKQKAPVELEKL